MMPAITGAKRNSGDRATAQDRSVFFLAWASKYNIKNPAGRRRIGLAARRLLEAEEFDPEHDKDRGNDVVHFYLLAFGPGPVIDGYFRDFHAGSA